MTSGSRVSATSVRVGEAACVWDGGVLGFPSMVPKLSAFHLRGHVGIWMLYSLGSHETRSSLKVVTSGIFPAKGAHARQWLGAQGLSQSWTWVQSFTSTMTLGPDLCFVFLTCSVGLIQDLTSWGAVHLK